VFQLHDVLRFDSTVVIYVLFNISYPRLKTNYFKISEHRVHEYASGLTSTLKAESFCRCKRRKFIGQNKAKFANHKVKILSF